MLIVRAEQFEKIIKYSDEDFVNYLFGYLKNNHGETIGKRSDTALRKMIRGGIKRAAGHDIEKVADTQNFIAKMFEIAPNFDEHSEIKAVLDDETLPPRERLEKLDSSFITKEVWAEAKNNYNEKAWLPEQKKQKPPN